MSWSFGFRPRPTLMRTADLAYRPLRLTVLGVSGLLVALVCLLCRPTLQARAEGAGDDLFRSRAARADAYLSFMARAGFSGTVLIARGDEVVLERGCGLANAAARTPCDAATRYEVGSISKLVTAIAAVRLSEEGKLDLDARLSDLLPGVPPRAAEITVDMLLRHTSGIGNVTPAGHERWTDGDVAARAILESLPESPATGRYSYSNLGFVVLARVIERASGQPFERVAASTVLVPAGAAGACFCGDHVAAEVPVADGHRGATSVGRATANPYGWTKRGATGLVMTARDLFALSRAVSGPTGVLRGAAARLAVATGGDRLCCGEAGVTKAGAAVTRFRGATPGFAAEMRCFATEGILIVVLANREHGAARIAGDIEEILDGAENRYDAFAVARTREVAAPGPRRFRCETGESFELRPAGSAMIVRPLDASAVRALLRCTDDAQAEDGTLDRRRDLAADWLRAVVAREAGATRRFDGALGAPIRARAAWPTLARLEAELGALKATTFVGGTTLYAGATRLWHEASFENAVRVVESTWYSDEVSTVRVLQFLDFDLQYEAYAPGRFAHVDFYSKGDLLLELGPASSGRTSCTLVFALRRLECTLAQ